jgi:hypothetical protein
MELRINHEVDSHFLVTNRREASNAGARSIAATAREDTGNQALRAALTRWRNAQHERLRRRRASSRRRLLVDQTRRSLLG